jgi:hypothetical protein
VKALATMLLLTSVSWATPETAAVKICWLKYGETDDGVTAARTSYGSGVCVAHGKDKDNCAYTIILTNAHVADGDAVYHVIHDGYLLPAEWLYTVPLSEREAKGDLALIRVWTKLPIASLAKSEPEADSEVFQWGFPGAGRLTKLGGKFLGNKGPGNAGDYLVVPGCSGSGVYHNDELIGVCFWSSLLVDKKNRPILKDGKPQFVPPCYMVTLKKIDDFLTYHVAKEMGYSVEKAPDPRPVLSIFGLLFPR